jgi:hypothetical protein
MPPADEVQWIQIRDFKPGLSDDPGSNYPAGAAQRSGTFRCVSNRNGALVPLPQRQTPFTMPHNGVQTAVTGIYYPPIGLLPSGGTGFNPNIYPEHEVFVGTEFQSGGNVTTNVRRFRRYEIPGTNFDTIQSDTRAQAAGAWRPSGITFVATRSLRSNPRAPGVPIVVFFSGSGVLAFPDDANPSANATYQIFPAFGDTGGIFVLNMAAHQGKVIIQIVNPFGQGVNTQTFMGESMIWSAINDVTTANWLGTRLDPDTGTTSEPAVMVPENPSGYAFMASMSANEIFAVKGHGGLYYTGDLDGNGSVVSLPMVTGAEIQQVPAINNAGVIYGNRGSGIWTWTHGPACQLLSPMMNPDFWTLPSPVFPLDDFGGISYSLTTLDDWIITPDNFLYDTQTNGWWRLEDDTVARFRYNTGLSHYLYCSESYYTDTYDTPVSFYARETPSTYYSWQSHPQWETIDTLIDVREITLRVRGAGQVKVTLTGETSTSVSTFSGVSTILPVLLRQPSRIQDANIAVKIEATGSGSPAVAPTVYECNLGYFPVQREKVTMT